MISSNPLANSKLFDEKTFFPQFINDLHKCQHEVIIESPYITTKRVNNFIPVFQQLLDREVSIYVITRDPKEHDSPMVVEAEKAITTFEFMGVQPLLCLGNHHRKLAILDREILWEGSLNILSQVNSREIMRRVENRKVSMEMFNFLKYEKLT